MGPRVGSVPCRMARHGRLDLAARTHPGPGPGGSVAQGPVAARSRRSGAVTQNAARWWRTRVGPSPPGRAAARRRPGRTGAAAAARPAPSGRRAEVEQAVGRGTDPRALRVVDGLLGQAEGRGRARQRTSTTTSAARRTRVDRHEIELVATDMDVPGRGSSSRPRRAAPRPAPRPGRRGTARGVRRRVGSRSMSTMSPGRLSGGHHGPASGHRRLTGRPPRAPRGRGRRTRRRRP